MISENNKMWHHDARWFWPVKLRAWALHIESQKQRVETKKYLFKWKNFWQINFPNFYAFGLPKMINQWKLFTSEENIYA